MKSFIRSAIGRPWLVYLLIINIKSVLLLTSLYSMNADMLVYSVYVSFMPIMLLVSFSFLLSGTKKKIYLISINLLISAFFIADIIYVRAFGHLISFYMIFAKGLTKDLGTGILSLIKWSDFLMLADIPFLIMYNDDSSIAKKTDYINRIKTFLLIFTISIIIIIFQFINIEATEKLGNVSSQPLQMSPIGYHLYDFYRFLYEKKINLSDQEVTAIKDWFGENDKMSSNDCNMPLYGLLKGKNIIAIQVESLENIVIGQSYLNHEITPNINRLLSNSIYFNDIYEQVRDGNSSDAELMFNTSIYPLSSGSAFMRFGENKYVSLPRILKIQGYTQIAIHGDDEEYWNRNVVYPALGFDSYIGQDKFINPTLGGMGVMDESLFDQSFMEINKLSQPYYIFMITLTSHMPFDVAINIPSQGFENDDPTSRYLKTIHYVDQYLGEFYEKLRVNGLLNNTAIIIYGDHEGVHKYYDTDLPDNHAKIPFIIYVQGMQGEVVDKVGGQVDMLPTLAFLMGIEKEKYAKSFMGHNLLSDNQGYVLLPNGNFIGNTEYEAHIRASQMIADMIIRGDYFDIENNVK